MFERIFNLFEKFDVNEENVNVDPDYFRVCYSYSKSLADSFERNGSIFGDFDSEETCCSEDNTTSIMVSAEIKAIDGQPEKHVIEFRKQDGDVGLYA